MIWWYDFKLKHDDENLFMWAKCLRRLAHTHSATTDVNKKHDYALRSRRCSIMSDHFTSLRTLANVSAHIIFDSLSYSEIISAEPAFECESWKRPHLLSCWPCLQIILLATLCIKPPWPCFHATHPEISQFWNSEYAIALHFPDPNHCEGIQHLANVCCFHSTIFFNCLCDDRLSGETLDFKISKILIFWFYP